MLTSANSITAMARNSGAFRCGDITARAGRRCEESASLITYTRTGCTSAISARDTAFIKAHAAMIRFTASPQRFPKSAARVINTILCRVIEHQIVRGCKQSS